MPYDAFISYRRDCSKDFAASLHEKLALEFGHERVFFDNDSLNIGSPFWNRIQAALDEAQVGLAIIGPKWEQELRTRLKQLADQGSNLEDHWREVLEERKDTSRNEDYHALELAALILNRAEVIPIFHDSPAKQGAGQLPQLLQQVFNRHGVLVPHSNHPEDHEKAIKRLIRALERLVRSSPIPPRLYGDDALPSHRRLKLRLLSTLGDPSQSARILVHGPMGGGLTDLLTHVAHESRRTFGAHRYWCNADDAVDNADLWNLLRKLLVPPSEQHGADPGAEQLVKAELAVTERQCPLLLIVDNLRQHLFDADLEPWKSLTACNQLRLLVGVRGNLSLLTTEPARQRGWLFEPISTATTEDIRFVFETWFQQQTDDGQRRRLASIESLAAR